MLPDRVSNPGPLTYESGALPIALRGPILYKSRHDNYLSVIGAGILLIWEKICRQSVYFFFPNQQDSSPYVSILGPHKLSKYM